MKRFRNSTVSFIVLSILILAALIGVSIPDNVPTQPVGNMEIAPFKTGLALFQNNNNYYYSFSPFNDYVVTPDSIRSSLITQDEINQNTFKSTFHSSKIADITQSVLSYFQLSSPAINFYGNNTIEYSTQIKNNTITITRKIIFPQQPLILGMTLNYRDLNFIYDKSGVLYTYQLPEDIATFEKIYGIKLTQHTDTLRPEVKGDTLYIANPRLASIIAIKAEPNQKIYVNKNAQLIEVEELVSGNEKNPYTSTLTVQVLPTPTVNY